MASFNSTDRLVRLFIGIKIPLTDETLSVISFLKIKLKDFDINWVNSENMHLTLKFIGEKPAYYINSINLVLAETVKHFSEFEIVLKSVGTFGKPKPSVVWIGIDKINSLLSLFQMLNTTLSEIGIEKEKRLFSPHLTTGRIKQAGDLQQLKEVIEKYNQEEFQKTKINSVVLFESLLTPNGPIYKVLGEHILSEPPKN